MALRTVNPTSGDLVREYEEHDDAAVGRILAGATQAQAAWRETPLETRGWILQRAAEELEARKDALAALMAVEMGKPLAQGRAEAEKCASVCRYYADGAARFLAPEEVATDARRSFVAFQPLGVVLAVMPWNFPLWQVFRFAAPSLMAGNAALLKHASNVTGCALAIEELLLAAGLPVGLFRALLLTSGRVAGVIDSPHVQAVTWPRPPGARSRRACSSSAAATRT
jgi:succinate-semialdehyde dehydrogenase / glutarate-semialdehyde dehydrogenase